MKTTLLWLIVAAALLAPRPAAAQGFINPFFGWNFGGDAKCLEITGCEEHMTNWGVAFGALGPVFGFEEEFGYSKNFFGEAPTYGSDVLTVMSNVILNAPIPVVRPYVVGGVGLIRSHVEPTVGSILSADAANNSFGWDFGGGVIVGGSNLGVRGDIRYFHTFQDLEFAGVNLAADEKLNFGRAAIGLFFKF
jgi:opacity protein-like surface antigen